MSDEPKQKRRGPGRPPKKPKAFTLSPLRPPQFDELQPIAEKSGDILSDTADDVEVKKNGITEAEPSGGKKKHKHQDGDEHKHKHHKKHKDRDKEKKEKKEKLHEEKKHKLQPAKFILPESGNVFSTPVSAPTKTTPQSSGSLQTSPAKMAAACAMTDPKKSELTMKIRRNSSEVQQPVPDEDDDDEEEEDDDDDEEEEEDLLEESESRSSIDTGMGSVLQSSHSASDIEDDDQEDLSDLDSNMSEENPRSEKSLSLAAAANSNKYCKPVAGQGKKKRTTDRVPSAESKSKIAGEFLSHCDAAAPAAAAAAAAAAPWS